METSTDKTSVMAIVDHKKDIYMNGVDWIGSGEDITSGLLQIQTVQVPRGTDTVSQM